MIGAGEGYTSAGAVSPILYAPAAPLAGEAVGGVLQGAYAVAYQHGTCLARTVRGIPQLGTEVQYVLEPTAYTEIQGCRWVVFVPAEVTTLAVVLEESLQSSAADTYVERRVIVTDGTNTDTGATTPMTIQSPVVTSPAIGDWPWPGDLWLQSRQRMIYRVRLTNCSPSARLTVYVEGRRAEPQYTVGATMLQAALYWSARG